MELCAGVGAALVLDSSMEDKREFGVGVKPLFVRMFVSVCECLLEVRDDVFRAGLLFVDGYWWCRLNV